MVKLIFAQTYLTHSPAVRLTGPTFPQLSTLTIQAHTDSESQLLSLDFIFIFQNVLLPHPLLHLHVSKQKLGAFTPALALNGRGQERRLSCRQVCGICWRHFSAQCLHPPKTKGEIRGRSAMGWAGTTLPKPPQKLHAWLWVFMHVCACVFTCVSGWMRVLGTVCVGALVCLSGSVRIY